MRGKYRAFFLTWHSRQNHTIKFSTSHSLYKYILMICFRLVLLYSDNPNLVDFILYISYLHYTRVINEELYKIVHIFVIWCCIFFKTPSLNMWMRVFYILHVHEKLLHITFYSYCLLFKIQYKIYSIMYVSLCGFMPYIPKFVYLL